MQQILAYILASALAAAPPVTPPAKMAAKTVVAAHAPKLMAWADLLSRKKPAATVRVRWGDGPSQFADLWQPKGRGPHPVVIMVHGGCWQAHIADLTIMNWIAEDLRRRGVAVWNIEYRGVDEDGGGWPGTLQDAAGAADALRAAAPTWRLRLDGVVAFGHSAGGHLAMWLAARPRLPASSPVYSPDPLPIVAVVSAGGLPDLKADREAKDAACGAAPVDLLAGAPTPSRPDVYAETSPAELLPLGVRQQIVNGDSDTVAPPWLGRAWRDRAAAAGDPVMLTVVAKTGHVELIAPNTDAWRLEERMILDLLHAKRKAK